jgi:hypothetical protein
MGDVPYLPTQVSCLVLSCTHQAVNLPPLNDRFGDLARVNSFDCKVSFIEDQPKACLVKNNSGGLIYR